jgi:hypothetical protein
MARVGPFIAVLKKNVVFVFGLARKERGEGAAVLGNISLRGVLFGRLRGTGRY